MAANETPPDSDGRVKEAMKDANVAFPHGAKCKHLMRGYDPVEPPRISGYEAICYDHSLSVCAQGRTCEGCHVDDELSDKFVSTLLEQIRLGKQQLMKRHRERNA